MFPPPTGEQLLASILKHDTKTTSYKIALLRALNDVALLYPEVGGGDGGGEVGVPLSRLAELWIAYYWPFVNPLSPIYQGSRGQGRADISFRPALTQLRQVWEELLGMPGQAGDGFFLLTEMRIPRRREGYSSILRQAYAQAVGAITKALLMPIKYAGAGTWNVFAPPTRGGGLAQVLPGTSLSELCLVVSASLWHTFRRLSAYVEALCLHEWALFTEGVTQDREVGRGEVYALLTARPDNRRSLTWERNQVDVLLHETGGLVCPWTQKLLTVSTPYDLDHLLPLSVYPVNELWNLLPVDREFNQRVKRDRIPSWDRLVMAEPWIGRAYAAYGGAVGLGRALREDAAWRFGMLGQDASSFPSSLAGYTIRFIEAVGDRRVGARWG